MVNLHLRFDEGERVAQLVSPSLLLYPGTGVVGRGFYTAPYSSSTMSSGRLFLDQVARQQSLSLLHRQAHGTTRAEWGTINLQRTVTAQKPVCLKKGRSPN